MAANKKTSVRGPGRPRKGLGISLPDMIAEQIQKQRVSDGQSVREVRATPGGQAGPVLPDARPATPETPGSQRVFATTDDLDGGRPEPKAQQSPFPDNRLRSDDIDDAGLSDWLRRIIREVAAEKYQDGGRRMSNAEVLARRMMERALEGDKVLQEIVADRVEGKATRALQPTGADTTLDEHLDRLDTTKLNSFAKDENNG